MSRQSNDKGRAYEFAWVNALYDELQLTRKVSIVKN